MVTRKLALFFAGVLCLFALGGCGSGGDSSTNGQLALTANASPPVSGGGLYSVVVAAVYQVAGNTSQLQGTPIRIQATVYTLTNGVRQNSISFDDNLSASSSGRVDRTYNIAQTAVPIFVDITASTGGISQTTTVGIPSL